MANFLASRKSARAWRGELSSSSMMAHRASATAWSEPVLQRSRALLSCRMVDLPENHLGGSLPEPRTRVNVPFLPAHYRVWEMGLVPGLVAWFGLEGISRNPCQSCGSPRDVFAGHGIFPPIPLSRGVPGALCSQLWHLPQPGDPAKGFAVRSRCAFSWDRLRIPPPAAADFCPAFPGLCPSEPHRQGTL